jgi:Family of unknown function (DUF5906)/Domain of unknown function (DUF3854)
MTPLTLAQLRKALFAKLAESGLQKKDAEQMRLTLHMTNEVKTKFPGLPEQRAGFRIPYFGFNGRATKFFRFRYLEKPTGFAALTARKELRYGQETGSLNEIYLAPFLNWEKVRKDTNQRLLITEGELKGACACKHGFPTVALGGVWCFKSGPKNKPFLDQLEQIAWKERPAFVVFDSDMWSNPDVRKAANAFAAELVQREAAVYVVRLPGPEKGLDDYLRVQGKDALEKLLLETQPWAMYTALHKLSEEVIYIRDPGMVFRLETLQGFAPKAFYDHQYSNRKFQISDGEKSRTLSAPRAWLDWPGRAEAEKVTYLPGVGRITPKGELNTWNGWGVKPEKGDVTPWKELLDHLFLGAKPEHRRWFEQWCAYPLQYPGTKMFTAVVLWSLRHGTGKSTVGYSLERIYGKNFIEINDTVLRSEFNDWAENKQFVLGDEITGGGQKKKDNADRLKSLITQQSIRINPKHVKPYTIPDCINYLFTSNHPDAFYIEAQDRRLFVHEVLSSQNKPPEFWTHYYDGWLRGEGAAALFAHLRAVNLEGFNPANKAPDTTAKDEMRAACSGALRIWVINLRENAAECLGAGLSDRTLWKPNELADLYYQKTSDRVNSMAMAVMLKKEGFDKVPSGCDRGKDEDKLRLKNEKGEMEIMKLWYIGPRPTPSELSTAQGVSARYYREREREHRVAGAVHLKRQKY